MKNEVRILPPFDEPIRRIRTLCVIAEDTKNRAQRLRAYRAIINAATAAHDAEVQQQDAEQSAKRPGIRLMRD